jgi:HAMP domain-containing protein
MMIDYSQTLSELRSQQAEHPLSTLTQADPIISSQSQNSQQQSHVNTDKHPSRPSDTLSTTTSSGDPSTLTPATLQQDLAHYKSLFKKLRFSYLEQVTKEKYLRSIVGDPPLVVSHEDNLALEGQLVGMKAELKGKKDGVERLVGEMEDRARDVAKRHGAVEEGVRELERGAEDIERLKVEVEELRREVVRRRGNAEKESDDPRMNMSLTATQSALEEQQAKNAEIDRQIAELQRQMPGKVREVEKMDRDLADLERKRNESARLAIEGRRRREEGGRDEMEEMGRWYRGKESVLRGLLGAEA